MKFLKQENTLLAELVTTVSYTLKLKLPNGVVHTQEVSSESEANRVLGDLRAQGFNVYDERTI